MRILVLLTVFLGIAFSGEAQIRKHKKKRSTNAGTLFVDFGMNRDQYFQSRLRLVGADYDITLKNVKAYDRLEKGQTSFAIGQFSGRVGYYFKEKWALSLGVDRLKYYLAEPNNATLSGTVEPGVDTMWTGDYYDQPVTTTRNVFNYQYAKGLNFIRIDLIHSFDLFEVGAKRQLAFTGNVGVAVGPLIASTDLLFGQRQTQTTTSFAGYALAASASLRIEFFKHFYVKAENSLGFAHVLHARTRFDDRNEYAKQQLDFNTFNLSVGAIFYLNTKNGCDSCPHW